MQWLHRQAWIVPPTAEDLADWLELCGKDENIGALRIYRVAAHYARRVDELESMILDHARGLGYDLQCEARKLMEEYDGD